MNKKTIAIVMPDLKFGGAERVAVNLANSLSQRNYNVHFIMLEATGEFLKELKSEIKIFDLKAKQIRGCIIPLIKYLWVYKPDSMLLSMWPLTIIGIIARWLSRVNTRIVVSEHTTWSQSDVVNIFKKGWKIKTTIRFIFPYADAIVCVSKGAADDLAEFALLDRNLISVIYNPVVNEKKFLKSIDLLPHEWWTGNHKRIISVGALIPVKDHTLLIDAFNLLKQKINVKLLIVGEGDCRKNLESQIKSLGLGADVFLPGFIEEPAPYFQRADLSVLSSRAEGFGNVLVESLSVGTPVVSSDCRSGPNEILCGGKYGILVPQGDRNAMAEAMGKSLSISHDSNILINRSKAFAVEKIVDQYELLLFRDGNLC